MGSTRHRPQCPERTLPLMDEHVQYFKDGAADRLHPNDKGHERMARTLYYQLSTLPCTF